jgi:hypothetical protein
MYATHRQCWIAKSGTKWQLFAGFCATSPIGAHVLTFRRRAQLGKALRRGAAGSFGDFEGGTRPSPVPRVGASRFSVLPTPKGRRLRRLFGSRQNRFHRYRRHEPIASASVAGSPEIPSLRQAKRISIYRNGAFWRFLALFGRLSSSMSNLLASLGQSTSIPAPSREPNLKMVRRRQARRLTKGAGHGNYDAARIRGSRENAQRIWHGGLVRSKGGFSFEGRPSNARPPFEGRVLPSTRRAT